MVPQDGASLQKLVKHLSGKQLGMLTEFFSREEQKSKKAGIKVARLVNQSPHVSPSRQVGGNESVIFQSRVENRSRTPHRLQPLKLQSPGNRQFISNDQPWYGSAH